MRPPLVMCDEPFIRPGPALLSGVADGPSLQAHRARHPVLPTHSVEILAEACDRVSLRGRGGAAFPFARKLRTAAAGRGRPVVVVNAAEGEPGSAKDAALALAAPHLVLDGAVAVATALRAREVHVIVPGERPRIDRAWRHAIAERTDRIGWRVHTTTTGFVAGQARAALELMAGRPGLPVTAWEPEAVRGHRGRPTLLSNAETWAQVGRLILVGEEGYREFGTRSEPGTTLLTIGGNVVVEAAYGEPLAGLLDTQGPVLVGGFHGSWLAGADGLRISVDELRAAGTPLGAGVVLPAPRCPVMWTAEILSYLAGESAGRCGPCVNGLPALAAAMDSVVGGGQAAAAARDRVSVLVGLLPGRGACAHPDGTARLARSLLTACAPEVAAHVGGGCTWRWAA